MNATVSTEVRPEVSISTWNIDPVHSTAQFKVKHMMISNVLGEFTSITGVLELMRTTSPNQRSGHPSMRLRLTPESRNEMRT